MKVMRRFIWADGRSCSSGWRVHKRGSEIRTAGKSSNLGVASRLRLRSGDPRIGDENVKEA
jgi:hypothetical protein